jgi:hypothetical protein
MASVDGTDRAYRAPAGVPGETWGILVGSGADVESFEDYKLQTPILNATLAHVASEPHSISYAALALKNTLIRYFNNNSGAPVNVNEVGIVSFCMLNGGVLALVCRDHLAATVTIPNTGQLKVTYTIQLTYPS